MGEAVTNLGQTLDRIESSAHGREQISLGTIVETIGGRSFGPLLLMAGVIMTSPFGGIPGMPTTMGVLVMSIAVQLVFGKKHFWLPRWLLRRSMARDRMVKALKWLRPPARFIDRFLRPRLPFFVQGGSMYVIAIFCMFIAAALPVMEIVPFSAHGAGVALTGFGLALIASDGLLALIAFAITVTTFGSVIYNLL